MASWGQDGDANWEGKAKTPAERQLLDGTTLDPKVSQEADVDVQTDKKIQFDMAYVSGDREIVESLKVWQDWEQRIPFTPVSAKEIEDFKKALLQSLHEKGYVFSRVNIPTRVWANGIFLVKADCAKLGEVEVAGNTHFSEKQLVGSFKKPSGTRFNYYDLHDDLYDLNTRRDLTIDTRLKPREENGRRIVDAEVEVEDRLPIHFGLQWNNHGSGVDDTDRLILSIQHDNLTQNFDSLHMQYITDPANADQLQAFAGNYSIPLPGKERRLDVFGGWSESDLQDVLPALDIFGSGEYLGLKLSEQLFESPKHLLRGGIGWKYRHSESGVRLGNQTGLEEDIDLSLFSLSLDYSSKQFDRFGGRNFASNTLIGHWGDQFGGSDEEEFARNRPRADESFIIERFSLSRVQRLPEDMPDWLTRSSIYTNLSAQISPNRLVTEVSKGIGGANSVRGYYEREVYGDSAVEATVEFRFPKFKNFFKPLTATEEELENDPEHWKQHGVQFLTFLDYGYAVYNDTQPGEDDSESMLGAGVGVRFDLSQYMQGKVDLGYPLQNSDESDGLRVHFSLQFQY